ncbi:MAG TPA: hypothetical protein GXX38_00770 [Clostridia bacterium]|nr:hypothetical protein [Clostridia bacterium]
MKFNFRGTTLIDCLWGTAIFFGTEILVACLPIPDNGGNYRRSLLTKQLVSACSLEGNFSQLPPKDASSL